MEQLKKILNYLPGFQSRKPVKMVVASLFYLVLALGMSQGIGDFIYGGSIFVSMFLIGFARTKDLSKSKVIRYLIYTVIFTVISAVSFSFAATVDPNFSKDTTSKPALISNQSSHQKPQVQAPQVQTPAPTIKQPQKQEPEPSQNNSFTQSSLASTESSSEPQTNLKEITVYRTKTGSKYHLSGCQYLRKSKIAITLSDAQAQGYDPCSVCNPPGDSGESNSNNDFSTAPSTPSASPEEAPPKVESKEYTIFVTKTGSKYHLDGCRYLSKSQIPMSLSQAKASGYEPCSVCGPPY